LRIKGQKARYLKLVEVTETKVASAQDKRLKQLEQVQQ